MSRRTALIFVAFFSLTSFARCAPQRSGAEGAEPGHETIVVVENGHAANVNVYLVYDGTRALLGKVNNTSRRTFQVPRTVLVGAFVDLQVVADAVGGGSFVSQQVRVLPGDEIKVYLTDHLQRSWITIRSQ